MVSNEEKNNKKNNKQLNEEQQNLNQDTRADSNDRKPKEDEIKAKQQEGYEHVSEGAVNKEHVGELEPKDIPPSLGGEAEINFPWDEEQPTVNEPDPDSEPLTDDGKIPEPPGKTAETDFVAPAEVGKTELPAKTEEAELPATQEEAEVPATTEEAELPAEPETQTPEEAAKMYQKSAQTLAELSFVKVFHPEGPDEETKIFTRDELNESTFAKQDGETTVIAGAAAQPAKDKETPEEPQNRREARKARREERKQNPKGPIRFIPVWLRLLIVIALCIAGLIIGLMLGYGFIGEGENPQDVLKLEFWQEIIDYIQGK